jgi:DNA end-binding protein Ku
MPERGRKLTVGFGLVQVPVAMKPLNETQRPIPGKTMCPEHGPNCSQVTVCSAGTPAEHVLEYADKATGYPHPDRAGELVIVEKAVVKELEESRTGTAQIERAVPADSIDAAYFDKVFLVWPQPGAEAAYDVLAAVLREDGIAAVATTVLTKQEETIVFRWSEAFEAVLGHVVRFDSMLRHGEAKLVCAGAEARPAPAPEMVEMGRTLFAQLAGEFDASEVADTLTPLMNDAIRAAANGRVYEVAKPAPAAAPAVDLMAALQASVAASAAPAKKPARKKVAA